MTAHLGGGPCTAKERPSSNERLLLCGVLRGSALILRREQTSAQMKETLPRHSLTLPLLSALHSCRLPYDHVPVGSWPLFRAREVMLALIESFAQEPSS